MHLHEYQAKQLLRDYGVPIPAGGLVRSPSETDLTSRALGEEGWVVKAQIHAGGRGKAGGVVAVQDAGRLHEEVVRLLGSRLVTPQTGPDGLPVDCVLIEQRTSVTREFYLSVLVDRATERLTFVASGAGGMDIEAVAAETPERVVSVGVAPATGLMPFQVRRVGFSLGLSLAQIQELAGIMHALQRIAEDCDAALVEINPLVLTGAGKLLALDAKINLDDNALFRQRRLADLRDPRQENEREVAARQHDLNYISLDGSIGCMVNGAGLAMATMDLVKLLGGNPANFLDVGGGTTSERVAEAFKLIVAEPRVRSVLVNIFGGIVRCDLIAEGIIAAVRQVGVAVPVVVRLEGTNARAGLAMLGESGLAITTAEGLAEAARLAIAAAKP